MEPDDCKRFLSQHSKRNRQPESVLSDLASSADSRSGESLDPDCYGEGRWLQAFESDVARELGKPAAVFMPSGTMAQPIALRVWSERKSRPIVAFHPKSHLEVHEHKAYQALHGLRSILVGNPDQLITLEDIKRIPEPYSALLLELPQRELGGLLPEWDELKAISSYARSQGIALHMDGARLWECQPFFNRPYAEICGLFDSVYVSFYKGLGAIAGAILAGPADFIAESRIWQRRQGGNLVHVYPYALSAQLGFKRRLSRMKEYHGKAVSVASLLNRLPGVSTRPTAPQTNMFHVYLRYPRERLELAARKIAADESVCLFRSLRPSSVPDVCMFELSVGDATLELRDSEIRDLFQRLLETACLQ